MTAISTSYLMWIGKEHYPTIEDYCKEAEIQGISKRLPNIHFAVKMAAEKSVVFLVHDEGQYEDCKACAGTGGKVRMVYDGCDGCREHSAEKGAKDHKALEGVEQQLTYREFNKILHQPKKFDPATHDIRERTMCDECGGTGRMPKGLIFGLFIPEAVEYILKPEDGEAVTAEMEKRGVKTITTLSLAKEKRRGCGVRKAGGYYITTATEKTDVKVTEVVKDLVEAGTVLPSDVEVKGNFARFVKPIEYQGKRFRGMKAWALDPRAEDEAQMILEGMEA